MVEKKFMRHYEVPLGQYVLCHAEIILICFQISRTTLNLAFNNLNLLL